MFSLISRLAWNPYYASTPRRHPSTRLKLPSTISSLDSKFELEVNDWCNAVTEETQKWTDAHVHLASISRRPDAKAPLLAAMAFPFADYTQLYVCAEVLQWMFLMQWWAFEGSYKCLTSSMNSKVDAVAAPSSAQNEENKIQMEEAILKLLESIISQIPGTSLAPVSSSLITYCDHLIAKSTPPPEDGFANIAVVTASRRKLEDICKIEPKNNETLHAMATAHAWCSPLFALLDFAYEFSDLDEKLTNDIKNAAMDIIQWTHDMLSFTTCLCRSSDPANHLERYPSWFVKNFLLEIIKSRRRTSLLSRIVFLSPPHELISIEDLQQAVDELGARIFQRMDDLHALRPTGSDRASATKERYWKAVTGLVAGTLHWSFKSESYFRSSSVGMHIELHCLLDVDKLQNLFL